MANVPLIAFDESGNTGQDLLNPDQPLFVLASVLMSNEEARELISPLIQPGNTEAHFSQLAKNQRGREGIIRLLHEDLISTERVMITMFHKRYMIVGKVVDLLVETLAHNTGFDLYKHSYNIALTNIHFICMPAFCGKEATDQFMKQFVHMIRTRSETAVNVFYAQIEDMYAACSNRQYLDDIGILAATRQVIGEVLQEVDKAAIDPAIPAYSTLASLWSRKLGARFNTIHDDSQIIASYVPHFRKLMDPKAKEIEVGYDDRKHVLPLKAIDILLTDSVDSPPVQVADILASATAYWSRKHFELDVKGDFWSALDSTVLQSLIPWALLPSMT